MPADALAGASKRRCGKMGGELPGEGSGGQLSNPSWKKTLQSSSLSLRRPEDRTRGPEMGLWPGLRPAASPTQSSQVSTTSPEIRSKDGRTIKGGVRWGGLELRGREKDTFLQLGGVDSYNPQNLTLG